jgi:L-ribulose-5-phosphate 3-epimerase
MKYDATRREFLAASCAAGAGLMVSGRLQAAEFKTTLKKSLIGAPTEDTLTKWKAAGFEGMESRVWDTTPVEAAKGRKIAEKLGMRIHSLLRGWTNFNSPDTGQVAKDIASVETALKAAQGYGAETVLLVPCKVGGLEVPQPWDFDIEFDEKTGMVGRVAEGDNSKYQAYIEAQNHATKATHKAVEKLIPVAEKTGVIIALENVWNGLWVKPKLFANFVASFDNPWVQCYYDIGNHVKYAKPEEWLEVLGKLIVKIHVKDFTIDKSQPRGGKFVDIRDGDVNWPAVRKCLDAIGYNGWMTIEGSGGLSLEEQNRRLELIIAGK